MVADPDAGASRRAALAAGITGMVSAPQAVAQPAGARERASGLAASAGHVVLLGDSIFDNRAYVGGGPDVVTQLRARLPPGWQATLAAVDGAVARDVERQLARLPPAPPSQGTTHLVLSVGGNDALRQEGVLGQPTRSVGEGLMRLAAAQEGFRQDYRAVLAILLARGLPLAVATIYDPRFADPLRQRLAVTGLALFNDVILREAFSRGLPVIDLRLVCDHDADFANPIEPSVQGGAKIAAEIERLVQERDAAGARTVVFTGRAMAPR
jgi:lysophospholipase L1-like esterase